MQTIAATKLKNKLGEVIDLARREPVMVQSHGRDIVVILDHAEFSRLRQLEDSYWAQRAEEAKLSGFLTPEETMARLQTRFQAETEA
jgi:prevent-host-death family protein